MHRPRLIAALFASLSLPLGAQGIRYIDYHVNNIPNIVTAAGIVSEIIFEPDEIIEYHNFGFGDGWASEVVRDHILVFKAQDSEPQTNLLVHTDKRDYVFTVTVGNNDWTGHPDKSGAVYSLRIRYHDGKTKAAKEAAEKEAVLRDKDISSPDTYLYHNYDYRATPNAADITPVRTWDNGKLTFIAFPRGAKRGTVYELMADGKAALVNQHTEKNGLLVIHGVYPRLIIRLGDEAVELRRNDRAERHENPAKTTVRDTRRIEAQNAPGEYRSGTPAPAREQAPVFRGDSNKKPPAEEPGLFAPYPAETQQ